MRDGKKKKIEIKEISWVFSYIVLMLDVQTRLKVYKYKKSEREMQGGDRKLAMLHIKKQFELAQKCEGDLSISVGLVDGDLFRWRVCFQGPESTPFEGGLYEATLNFPDDYPYQPPKMAFVTEMFHPNIYKNGEVCISILHPPVEDPMNPMQKLSEKWNPVLTIEAVLMSVTSMLVDPNLDSPANVDAAKLLKESRKEYDRKLRYLARKSIGDV